MNILQLDISYFPAGSKLYSPYAEGEIFSAENDAIKAIGVYNDKTGLMEEPKESFKYTNLLRGELIVPLYVLSKVTQVIENQITSEQNYLTDFMKVHDFSFVFKEFKKIIQDGDELLTPYKTLNKPIYLSLLTNWIVKKILIFEKNFWKPTDLAYAGLVHLNLTKN